MIRTRGVAHFTIPVSDTERSARFYTERLGMKVVRADHARGMVFLDCGGDCVILARVAGPIATSGVRDVHHAFKVAPESYQDDVRELKDSGVEVLFEEDRQGGAVNGPRAYFHDPDGNVLEIIALTGYAGAED